MEKTLEGVRTTREDGEDIIRTPEGDRFVLSPSWLGYNLREIPMGHNVRVTVEDLGKTKTALDKAEDVYGDTFLPLDTRMKRAVSHIINHLRNQESQ